MKIGRPLMEVIPVAEMLLDSLRPFCESIEYAGSIRRQKEFVGDIEILLQPKLILIPPKNQLAFTEYLSEKPHPGIMQFIRRFKIIRGDLDTGKMMSFVGPQNIQVDVFTSNKINHGYIKLLRTGSSDYNRNFLMPKLKEAGIILEDGFLWKGGNIIPVSDEADVYQLFGYKTVHLPKDREKIGQEVALYGLEYY